MENCTVVMQPFLMQGKKKIAETFGVTPDKVKEWIREGAPIFEEGRMFQADYSMMVVWLVQARPALKNGYSEKSCQVPTPNID